MGVRLDGRCRRRPTRRCCPTTSPATTPTGDYLPGLPALRRRRYLLICDNLLDFSHLSYVHEKTLGGSTAIAQARAEIEAVPRGIRVTRRVPRRAAAAATTSACARFSGNLDRWFIYDFVLPGTLLMHSGGRPVGRRRRTTCAARCGCTAARR